MKRCNNWEILVRTFRIDSGQVYAYQYWVCDVTNRPVNSPAVVKTADPFSTLVLSPLMIQKLYP